MQNLDIRKRLKENKIMQWQLADAMGISEMTLVRKLRYELLVEEKQKIISVIDKIIIEKGDNKNECNN